MWFAFFDGQRVERFAAETARICRLSLKSGAPDKWRTEVPATAPSGQAALINLGVRPVPPRDGPRGNFIGANNMDSTGFADTEAMKIPSRDRHQRNQPRHGPLTLPPTLIQAELGVWPFLMPCWAALGKEPIELAGDPEPRNGGIRDQGNAPEADAETEWSGLRSLPLFRQQLCNTADSGPRCDAQPCPDSPPLRVSQA